jgi:hypothetical protein
MKRAPVCTKILYHKKTLTSADIIEIISERNAFKIEWQINKDPDNYLEKEFLSFRNLFGLNEILTIIHSPIQ